MSQEFGWMKQIGPLCLVKLRGMEKVEWPFVFRFGARNPIRLPRLMAHPPEMLKQKCAGATVAGLGDDSQMRADPYKHRTEPHSKQTAAGTKRKRPAKTPPSGEFQRVPRSSPRTS